MIKDLTELCRSVLEQHDNDVIGDYKDNAEEAMQVDDEKEGGKDDDERKNKDRLAKTGV